MSSWEGPEKLARGGSGLRQHAARGDGLPDVSDLPYQQQRQGRLAETVTLEFPEFPSQRDANVICGDGFDTRLRLCPTLA